MHDDTKEERNDALQVVVSSLRRCENIQPKFAEGTSQHSLLRGAGSAARFPPQIWAGCFRTGGDLKRRPVKHRSVLLSYRRASSRLLFILYAHRASGPVHLFFILKCINRKAGQTDSQHGYS